MPKLLTIKQAARLLQCHPDTIRRRLKAGLITHRTPPGSRRYMFLADDLIPPAQYHNGNGTPCNS